MEFLKNSFLTGFYPKNSNNTSNIGVVGVSVAPDNIAMAHVSGLLLNDITVNSYRYVPTENKQEQLDALLNYANIILEYLYIVISIRLL